MKVQDDEYIFPISNLFRKEQSHQIYKRIIDLVMLMFIAADKFIVHSKYILHALKKHKIKLFWEQCNLCPPCATWAMRMTGAFLSKFHSLIWNKRNYLKLWRSSLTLKLVRIAWWAVSQSVMDNGTNQEEHFRINDYCSQASCLQGISFVSMLADLCSELETSN